jgi:hypothetical protein
MEAAFFDLDKTVIDRASIAAFGRPFMKGAGAPDCARDAAADH